MCSEPSRKMRKMEGRTFSRTQGRPVYSRREQEATVCHRSVSPHDNRGVKTNLFPHSTQVLTSGAVGRMSSISKPLWSEKSLRTNLYLTQRKLVTSRTVGERMPIISNPQDNETSIKTNLFQTRRERSARGWDASIFSYDNKSAKTSLFQNQRRLVFRPNRPRKASQSST